MKRYQIITQDEITRVHETSLKILEEVGVIFTYEPAREMLASHGAKVDGETVYLPASMVEEKLKAAPSSFTLYSRNPERNVTFDMETTHYCGPGGSPFVMDAERGRRISGKDDFIELIKLFQSFDQIEMHHVPCDMSDVDEKLRNRMSVYLTMKYSDKPFMPFMYTYEEAKTCIEMAALPFGGLDEVKNKKPVILADPCTTTPLGYDDKALGTLMAFAEYGQIQLINSLCMAGTTAPVTLAGNAAVQNAEILAGIVLAQCVNPGTPVIYSASSAISDMRTGALSVGSPETAIMSLMNGMLAKFYGLPCRISGAVTDSPYVGAQSAYESAINMMTAEMAGGNFILHGCGILETYNTVCLEKAVTDHEVLGMMKRINRGVEVNEKTLAFDVIKKVGPQGQFLGEKHTLKNCRKEHFMPKLSDRRTYDQWKDSGAQTIEEAATAKWKAMLEGYVQPDFSAELDEDLQKFF